MSEKRKLTGLQVIRNSAFILFFALLSYTSVNLFYSFADPSNYLEVGTFMVIALVLELFKIYMLVLGNTASLILASIRKNNPELVTSKSFGLFFNGQIIPQILDYRKERKKMQTYYLVYVLTAIMSLSGSFGWILQTVDYNLTQKESLVTTEDKTTVLESKTVNILDKLSNVQDKIQSKQDFISSKKDRQKSLDKLSLTYQKEWDVIQKEIDKLLVEKDSLLNDKDKLLSDQQQSVSNTLDLKKTQVVTEVKAVRNSSYKLISKATLIPEDIIMFTLLGLLSVLFEVGLFLTSPHFRREEENDIIEMPVIKEPEPKVKKKRKPRTVALPSAIEVEEKKVVEIDIPAETEVVEPTEEPPAPEPVIESSIKLQEPLVVRPKRIPIPETKIEEQSVLSNPDSDTRESMVMFVKALFDNGTKGFLKDVKKASSEANISLIQAQKYFEWLTTIKGKTGYMFIEFRSPNWYPNYTAEYIITSITESEELPK